MALWLFSVFLQYHPNPSPMRPKRRILSRKSGAFEKEHPGKNHRWPKKSIEEFSKTHRMRILEQKYRFHVDGFQLYMTWLKTNQCFVMVKVAIFIQLRYPILGNPAK